MDKVVVIVEIQKYIAAHFQEEDFSVKKICERVNYSRRQIDRMFKTELGVTLQEYIAAVRLTQSSNELLKTETSILEIALTNHYQSHEGFTRSFKKRFGLTPSEYRDQRIPLPLFTMHPLSHYYAILEHKEASRIHNRHSRCTITVQHKPRRKLLFLPAHHADDYLSYCEEMGCDWEGLQNSIQEKFEPAALLTLPEFLSEGFAKTASGIEVPLDYDKILPQGYEVVELPESIMLSFQSAPYENEESFSEIIDEVYEAIEKYIPADYGYKLSYESGPVFNYGAQPKLGARIAVPAISI
ncbi:helix-turn-helix transcriptional regulator [Enterococcus sp. LJL128]